MAEVTYLDSLEEAWQAHLAPWEPDAPTIVSTFAGCGGSSLGYSMAGFRELLAVEWDDNAVETFRLNFPEVPVYHGDIAALSVESALERTGLAVGALDVLDGSPPCQGFSTAGKRNLADDRNQLFREFCRLLKGLQPRAFVMENVSGMVKGKMRLVFVEILRELKACGYRVSARLMDAAYFGVPQHRRRMIFIGAREDTAPSPTHPRASSQFVTVRQAIGHIPGGTPGKHESQVIAAWYKSRPGEFPRKASHHVGSFQSVRLDPDKPSNTQVKSHFNWRYDVPRQLTPLEAGLIGSFPESYHWAGKASDAKQRIGNSVPPLFMRAIAQHIRETILTPEPVRGS